MADQETDFFFDPSCDPLTTEALQFEPLFIREGNEGEGEDDEEGEGEEERFEDCVEELQSALGFSRRCRAAMEEEFSGLMAQMMAEIEEYDSLLHSATLGCCLTDGGHGHAHGYGGILGGVPPTDGLTPISPQRPPPQQQQQPPLGMQFGLQAAVSPPGLQGAPESTGGPVLQLTREGGEEEEEQFQHLTSGEQERSSRNGDNQNVRTPETTESLGDVGTVTGVTAEPGATDTTPATPVTAETEVTRDLDELGALFEGCIVEVGRLERRRDELVTELLELERPLAEGVRALRDELGEAQTQLQRCSLQKDEARESVRLLKKQLFAVAKACAQSQMELSSRKHDVQRLNTVQEELEAQVQALTEEASQLRSEHAGRLQNLHEQQEAQGSAASSADLSQSRRAPCDLQQYLQGALSALEEWYEPRLVALLKRREAGQEALRRAREQAQGLRSQLGPLRDEHQRLRLQRTCLEERRRLMEDQRVESVQQYKETVEQLEENSRELRMELQLQQRKTREMEALKNSLVKQLCLYRASPEDHEEVKPPALGDQQPSMVEVQT